MWPAASGSIAEGITRLGLKSRPANISELHATAAVGQMGLVQAYEACFQAHGLHSAQILLTHADLSNRRRYLNARSTLRALLEFGTVPVVNENDSVSNEEIRFGDNDTLGAMVTNLIEKPREGEPTSPYYNAGIYSFSPDIFHYTAKLELSPRGEYELTDAIKAQVEDGLRIAAVELEGDWADVRDPETLQELNEAG